MIRNNQNRRRRGGNNNGPRPQQMNGGNNYGNRLDNRQRGNASQLLEKYRALARDAQQAGDRVTAEYYLQYADHYFRVLGDYREKAPNDGRQRGREFYEDDASGYSAGSDDSDGNDDDDQDGDRSEDAAADPRGDDRSQWREERGAGNANGGRNRDGNRDAPREARSDTREARSDTREARPDSRGDSRNNDGRDRQNWNGNAAPRNRDDNRGDRQREDTRGDQRPRDDSRGERFRDDNRADRPRERRPEIQRPAPVESVSVDEGPIPGLPGPATLRVKRPLHDGETAQAEMGRAERPVRTLRREPVAVAPEAGVAESPVEAMVPPVEAETAPRRRGRPRKVVDAEG